MVAVDNIAVVACLVRSAVAVDRDTMAVMVDKGIVVVDLIAANLIDYLAVVALDQSLTCFSLFLLVDI